MLPNEFSFHTTTTTVNSDAATSIASVHHAFYISYSLIVYVTALLHPARFLRPRADILCHLLCRIFISKSTHYLFDMFPELVGETVRIILPPGADAGHFE